MYLTIIFLALWIRQTVSSVPEKDVPSANATNILFSRATDPTYAIDGSCNRYPQVQGIVNDWLEIAQATSRRMNLGSGDPHFQYAFQIVFGTSPDNPKKYRFPQLAEPATAFTFVKFITNNLASLTLQTNRYAKAVLIFYCDDDEMNATPYTTERWQVRPDIPGSPNPNSGRTLGVDQEWFDQYNFITRVTKTKGCKDAYTMLEAYHTKIEPFQYGGRSYPVGLQPLRSTITICDYAIALSNSLYPTVASSLGDSITLPGGAGPLALRYAPHDKIVSAALYHETTHIAGLDLRDVKLPDGTVAYGWTRSVALKTKSRLINADNYMFLGLLARYETLGVYLDPDDEANANLGGLVKAPAGWTAP